MDINSLEKALHTVKEEMGDEWFSGHARELSGRAHFVLTLLLVDCTKQEIRNAILDQNIPNGSRRIHLFRAAEEEVNILLGEIAHAFDLFEQLNCLQNRGKRTAK